MTNPPRTKEQARACKYGPGAEGHGVWYKYLKGNCAYRIRYGAYQCMRRALHGPANLYCKQHARIVEKGKG